MTKALLKELVLPGVGMYGVSQISLGEAREWAVENTFSNHVGPVLAGVLGVEQEQAAANDQYEEALVIRPTFDVNPDRIYTSADIQEAGVECLLITKLGAE